MTKGSIDAFRAEHTELLRDVEQLRDLARALRYLPPGERADALKRAVAFLRGPLAAHAEAEEECLHPTVKRITGQPGATEPMVHDHAAIRRRVEALAAASSEDMELLEELLYGLYALVAVHLDAEEQIFLPVLEHQQGRELRGMTARWDGHPTAA